MKSRILIVDDEAPLRALLERVLTEEGYLPQSVSGGQAALKLLAKERFDLLILDLLLPGLAGEEICNRIRQDPDTRDIPILVLTGLNSPEMESKMLNIGADDFIAKPFEREGLAAHVRALLRRPRGYVSIVDPLQTGRLTIHVGRRSILLDGKPMEDLAPKEFELLRNIVQSAPNVIEKAQLAQKVWGMSLEHLHYRTLDVHIQRVRKKLGQAAPCLKTIPAIGYQWWETT